jgi:hypothetical protein
VSSALPGAPQFRGKREDQAFLYRLDFLDAAEPLPG